jgi:hypothetical protein
MPAIPALTMEAQIKRQLRKHLRRLGFVKDSEGRLLPPESSKECFRLLHSEQRRDRLQKEACFIQKNWPILNTFFANGDDVVPERIDPYLEPIKGDTWQSDLFRLASLYWSVPVSLGYGRRMRFLVWDKSNEKLIGLIALGDPVFNLQVRDEWIGWDVNQRKEKLVGILDAYVLGALPPYNELLGGKLLASLICTKEVVRTFSSRYKNTKGIISQKHKSPQLCMVTTTSALGRSSIYNRLKLSGREIFKPIGYTSGWGHFHIPESLFSLMRDYLAIKDDTYASNHRFGDGPNWKLRAANKALTLVGLEPKLLRHGISREVFACEIAQNAREVLSGKTKKADYGNLLSVKSVTELAMERWIIPRSERSDSYRAWRRRDFLGHFGFDNNLCPEILPEDIYIAR